MTGRPPHRPPPSRAHVLMREGRTRLLGMYFAIAGPLPGVATAAVANRWSRERITDAIITLENEEAPDDLADHV